MHVSVSSVISNLEEDKILLKMRRNDEASGAMAQFEKVFVFKKASEENTYRLPVASKWFGATDEASCDRTLSPELASMKEELNAVKSKLNRLQLETWHKHTREVNPAATVVQRVRSEANRPELLTQAWCKFTECLNRFDLVDNGLTKNAPFHSLHLCEAPGAFVAALNHHLGTTRADLGLRWKWVGNTLNPYYEGNPTSQMINDDRLVMHTEDNWDFGDDDTGDVLDYDNRRGIRDRVLDRLGGQVDLVTADGSIDCQADPANQEGIVSALHATEVALALNVLAPGGSFVLKMFTLFEAVSGMIVYVLVAAFDSVAVFKPATSKEGNSEVYIVCKGFKDNLGKEERDLLLKHCHRSVRPFDLKDIPKEFVSDLVACCRFFKEIQCAVIEKNLDTFNNGYDKQRLRKRQAEVASKFVQANNISPLAAEKKMVSKSVQRVGQCLNLDARVEMETFEDRLKAEANGARKVAHLKETILSFRPPWAEFNDVEWLRADAFWCPSKVEPVYGKTMNRVASSKFCPSKVIELFNMTVDLKKRDSNGAAASPKRRRVEASDWCTLSEALGASELLRKMTSIYPIVPGDTKVISEFSFDRLLSSTADLANYLNAMTNALSDLSRGDHLIVCDVPLLRRVDVAILHMIAASFEEVGFIKPRGTECAIFFSEFRGEADSTNGKLKDVIRLLEGENKGKETRHQALMQVTAIRELIAEPTYSYIVAFNLLSLKEKSLYMLSC